MLLLDVGNTRIKWALYDGTALRPGGDWRHGGRVEWPAGLRSSAPAAVWAANVAGPAMRQALEAATRDAFGVGVRFAATAPVFGGVRCGYHDPSQLGVDRWLAVLAAWDRHRGPACVVDAGTALTVDLVRGDGSHLGGVIVPGIGLMRASLDQGTGDIGRHAARGPAAGEAPAPGRDTASAVRGGSLMAAAGLVQQCLARLGGEAANAALLVTGGDAPALLPALAELAPAHHPCLVLEGLALVADAADS